MILGDIGGRCSDCRPGSKGDKGERGFDGIPGAMGKKILSMDIVVDIQIE